MNRDRAGFATAIVIALATALAGCRSANPALYPPRPGDVSAEAIVLDNHWHTALIFRSADLPAAFRDDVRPFAYRRYVAIGWGDEGFFRAEHITPGLIAQALFYSRGSVMLVSGFDDEPEAAFDPGVDVYRVPIGRAGQSKMIDAMSATFRREAGHVVDAGPGIDHGRFYAANGRYAFYHTCNQWTADGLAAAGLPISAAYAGTAGNVAFQLGQLAGVRRNGLAVPRPVGPDAALLRLTRGGRP